MLEMKLKYKDTEWRIGYAFDSTKLTESGNVTLTITSFTKWEDGGVTKELIDEARYRELLREWFGM